MSHTRDPMSYKMLYPSSPTKNKPKTSTNGIWLGLINHRENTLNGDDAYDADADSGFSPSATMNEWEQVGTPTPKISAVAEAFFATYKPTTRVFANNSSSKPTIVRVDPCDYAKPSRHSALTAAIKAYDEQMAKAANQLGPAGK